MKIKDIIQFLESIAPASLQEDYDNCGLQTGNSETVVTGILITLDCTEEVIQEAIKSNCNLVIAHHPVIFKAIKSLTGKDYVERTLLKAIRNDIAIFALHTNLDNVWGGVNHKIAQKLGLINTRILAPKNNILKKLVTYIPEKDTARVVKAIHEAGGGKIGNYSECSFFSEGTGTFKPNAAAHPAIGEADKLESVKELRTEIIFPNYLQHNIIHALKSSHPYEEPAFDILPLDNVNQEAGAGLVGELETAKSEEEFLAHLKNAMGLSLIRHTSFTERMVKKIALCGGSGSFLLPLAKKAEAQVYVSSDFKYHEFFNADGGILIADINHYEGEVFTKELIYEHLNKKFSNIALVLSNVKTNPISYL